MHGTASNQGCQGQNQEKWTGTPVFKRCFGGQDTTVIEPNTLAVKKTAARAVKAPTCYHELTGSISHLLFSFLPTKRACNLPLYWVGNLTPPVSQPQSVCLPWVGSMALSVPGRLGVPACPGSIRWPCLSRVGSVARPTWVGGHPMRVVAQPPNEWVNINFIIESHSVQIDTRFKREGVETTAKVSNWVLQDIVRSIEK